MSREIAIDEAKSRCCLFQGEKCCRYLGFYKASFRCLKNDKHARPIIDNRYESGDMTAKGDLCEGLEMENENGH